MAQPTNLHAGLVVLVALVAAVSALEVELDSSLPSGARGRIAALLEPYASQVGVIACGKTPLTKTLITEHDLKAAGPEGYVVRVVSSTHANGSTVVKVAVDGNGPAKARYDRFFSSYAGRGTLYGCYRVLEQLGFTFFHPLQPTSPLKLSLDQDRQVKNESSWPHYTLRTWHVHSQHPLELTDFLNGFDVVINGTTVETWESMHAEWTLFLEWCLANGVNRVEFLPLYGNDWADFAFSDKRQARLRNITDTARLFAVSTGADVAIAEEQQHAMTLIDASHPFDKNQTGTIYERMGWLAGCGFDFFSTENGFSEFTHPNDETMLLWMNISTEAASSFNMSSFIKCHCSSGQVCKDYVDPRTGQPLNFNFLPVYADERMGVMVHTVQMYSFDDPANTYGNSNFSFMYDFLNWQVAEGRRSVQYYGETAYWVNYDINVPLFLPQYALARLSDLRSVLVKEMSTGKKMDGQANFDSGWEWGYWVQDVITARAAWRLCSPKDCKDDIDTLRDALKPIARGLAPNDPSPVEDAIVALVEAQHRLLVQGRVSPNDPEPKRDSDVIMKSGQAYVAGWDTFAELSEIVAPDDVTQPRKLTFEDARFNRGDVNYWQDVEPLLAAMEVTFQEAWKNLTGLHVRNETKPLLDDMIDGTYMLYQRCRQLHALYDFVASDFNRTHGHNEQWRKERLSTARDALQEANVTIGQREAKYRVPIHRVAGWRTNPTAYAYTYLWTAHSLYYWWRDHAKATLATAEVISPCFMNLQNPADVAFGEGAVFNATELIYKWAEKKLPGLDFLWDCLHAPESEPHYNF